ncbi:hypothetical protein Q5752_001638 [Cryptotrichosporon argae]
MRIVSRLLRIPRLARASSSLHERPLAGIRIVDLTRVLAGPLATMMLADLGADVVKIESPLHGDDTRAWAPPSAPLARDAPRPDLPPESAYFLQANRNKRSLTLNLKMARGQAVARRLVERADVLVENYVPGKLDAFGLGYEQVRAVNPGLVYCSITGYGSTGPYAKNPGYDVVIEAEAGLMHITGEKGGRPVKVGVAVTDILTGHYAQSGILAALLRRAPTGQGGRVETSLFESQIASLANIGANYLVAGQEAGRWGTSHPSIVPYQVFPTKDSWIMLSAGNEGQWRMLCAVLDRHEVVCEVGGERVRRLGPINNIEQTFKHPQAVARGVVEEVDHPRAGRIKLAAAAVTYDGEKPKAYRPPPYLGQHTDEVLAELGYDAAEIGSMRADGVV